MIVIKKSRIEYAGAVYHVTQRGNNQEPIFGKTVEKETYLDLLKVYKARLDFQLFGYAIMDNHFHLLVKTGEVPLSKIMHPINTAYGKYYNHENNRDGHVFSSRYYATLILDEDYLFSVLRYIHWNPVRADICQTVSEYNWTSDWAYQSNNNSFVDIDFILNITSSTRSDAINNYRQMMKTPDDFNYMAFRKKTVKKEKEFEREKIGRKAREVLLRDIGASDEEIMQIKSGSRSRPLIPLKQLFIKSAIEEGYSFTEIGEFMNLSKSAVYKLSK
ncbi:MAG: transposase [Bacillota bacterium]|nr:transposase [Bacillota bacterium]